MPGGFEIGDEIWFKGSSCYFDDGDKVEYGMKGKITKEHSKEPDKRVLGMFPGNKGTVGLLLSNPKRMKMRRTITSVCLVEPEQLETSSSR